MGSGHSKEDSKKESKRSSRHAPIVRSTTLPSSKSKSCSSSKCNKKSGSKSSKGGSSSSKDPCADLTPEALRALRNDFLSKLSDPQFVTQKHIIWGQLTTRQQKKCQVLQATFYDVSDEEMKKFRDEWRREYPEDMDYGYNVEEDTLYAQQGQRPRNALGIFQNEDEEEERGRPRKRQTQLLPALPIFPATPAHRPANPPPGPITPAVRGMIPEDYTQIQQGLRNGGNKSSSSKPSSAEPSSSKHSSHRHSSHRHSCSKHGSSKHSSSKHSCSKHSSSKSGKSSSHHHKSSSSRH